MSIDRFNEYAATFEDVFKSGDWSRLEPYFTEAAVYEILGGEPFAGRYEGRQAVIEYLKRSVEGFDQRFEDRELTTLKAEERGDSVWIQWRITYRVGGAELSIEGEETATFEGNRIVRLEDRFSPEASALTQEFFAQHGDKLAPEGT